MTETTGHRENDATEATPLLRRRWLQCLTDASLPDPALELNALWRTTSGSPLPLLAGSRITARLQRRMESRVLRRAQGEPLARITLEREFASLPFRLNDACLVPRADSETLLEAVLALATSRYPLRRIAELGCGSGCIVLALAVRRAYSPRRATLTASDISAQALFAAKRNARALRKKLPVRFLQQDWRQNWRKDWHKRNWSKRSRRLKHDLLFANPPYIRRSERISLAPEVARFEPPRALDGGFDGLLHFRHILRYAQATLACGGFLALEHAPHQARLLKTLARKKQFRHIRTLRDLAGHNRATVFRKHRSPKALVRKILA